MISFLAVLHKMSNLCGQITEIITELD